MPASPASARETELVIHSTVVFMSHYAGWPSGARMNSIVEVAIDKASKAR